MDSGTRQRLIPLGAAADMLGVGRSLAYSLVASGELRTIKIGRRRLVPVAAIDEFVARRMAESADQRGGGR